jgi:hypothetical protein
MIPSRHRQAESQLRVPPHRPAPRGRSTQIELDGCAKAAYRRRCRIFDTVRPDARSNFPAPTALFIYRDMSRLRLAPASGISTRNGDVAEWLKAAVC